MANELTIQPKVNKGIKNVVKFAADVNIVTHTDMVEASQVVKTISELKDAVETQRTSFTKPLNESLRAINAFFKKVSVPLDTADKAIRANMVEFQKQLPENADNTFGEVHFTTTTKFEVIDIKKVPAAYLKVDEVAVNKAIAQAGGKLKIAGIKIVQEKRVSL